MPTTRSAQPLGPSTARSWPFAFLPLGALILASAGLRAGPAAAVEGSLGPDHHPVAGITTEAEEAWRLDLDGLLSEPAAGPDDLAFAVVLDGKTRKLVAVDYLTGELRGEQKLKKGEGARVYAVDGGVVLFEEKQFEIYDFDPENGKFKRRGKPLKGPWSGEPALHGNLLVANDQKRKVHVIDLESGKELAEARGGFGQPAIVPGSNPGSLEVLSIDYGGEQGYQGTYLFVIRARLEGIGERKVSFEAELPQRAGLFGEEPTSDGMHALRFSRWQEAENSKSTGYFLQSPFRIAGGSGPGTRALVMGSDFKGGRLHPLASPAAFDGQGFCGYDEAGNLYRATAESGGVLKKSEYLHGDARPGPAAASNDRVILIGNMAIASYNGETLWMVPDAAPGLRMIPIADGRVLYGSTDGDLVCLVDPALAEVIAAERAPEVVSPLELAATVRLDAADGLLLAEGLFVPGEGRASDDGSGRIELASGEEFEFDSGEVAAAIREGQLEVYAEEVEFAVFAGWRRALYSEYAATLTELFEQYLEIGFPTSCDRVLKEANDIGMSGRWLRDLERRLEAEREGLEPGSSAKRDKLTKTELAEREEIREGFKQAAGWCIERELPLAASALLGQGDRILGGDDEIRATALTLIQEGFPHAERPSAHALWLEWSLELLPAGGEFIPADDEFWETVAGTVWEKDKDTFGLRSSNVVLLCRDTEPRVIGACLRYAEGTVRALEELLPYSAEAEEHRNRQRKLELRVHASRADYLEEASPDGTPYAMPWSAGFYSPADEVSRFYVEKGEFTSDPLGRSMFQTLAHEVTHHFIDFRLLPDSSYAPGHSGYWIVEGFASFIGDQIVDPDQGRTNFDDPEVEHLKVAARGFQTDQMFRPAELVDATRRGFDTLSPEPGTMGATSQISMFYEESASLVWFLMNTRGDDGRQAVSNYLEAYYTGRMGDQGWLRLGFDSAEELDAAFAAFLKRVPLD